MLFGILGNSFGQCPPVEPPLAPYLADWEGLPNSGLATFANCWTSTPVSATTSGQGWRVEDGQTTSSATGPAVDNTTGTVAGKYIYLETSGGATGALSSFESPEISLDNLGPNRELSFYYHLYGATTGTLTVSVFNGVAYTTVFTITGQQQTALTSPWTKVTVPLAAYSGAIKVKFDGTRGTSFTGDMAIDDIFIGDPITCPSPDPVTATVTSATTANVTWTHPSATSFEYVNLPAGSAAPTSGAVVSATSAALTGLSLGSSYDFYVRAICSPTDQSIWKKVSYTVGYCASNSTSTADSKIGAITLGGTTVPAVSTCASYTNNMGLAPFQLQYAVGTPITVNYLTCSASSFASYSKVYIDFNQDLTFDEVTELVAQGNSSSGAPLSANLAIPASGSLGTTAMRIVLRESGSSTLNLACGTYSYGETQDFLVNMSAAPACAPPALASATAFGRQATVRWYGSAVSYNIEYGISGFTPGTGTTASAITDTFVVLSSLTPTTSYQYYLRSNCTSGNSPVVGPFNFTTTVSCPAPSTFTGTVSATTANLTWQVNGISTSYVYVFGPSGTTVANGTKVVGSGNALALSGLTANTAYQLYVANICGVGDTSAYSAVVNFTTLCNAFNAPYTQNFNAMATNLSGTVDCWNFGVSPTVTNLFWRTNVGATGSLNTGPATGNGGSGSYFYLETSSSGNDTALALSPVINISSLSNPQLSFYYNMYGATMGRLRVDVWNGTNWVLNVWNRKGQQHASETAPWSLATVSLAGYSGNIAIRFAGSRNGDFTGDMAIDDVSIQQASPCAFPTALTATPLSSTSVQLAWTPGSMTATQWVVKRVPAAVGMPTVCSTVSSSTTTISGLMANSTHAFSVGEICSNLDTSWFTPSVNATTYRAPYFLEAFTQASGSIVNPEWQELDGKLGKTTTAFTSTTASNWLTDGMANNGTTGAYRCNIPTAATLQSEWIVTPSIDLGTSMNYELRWQSAITTSSGTVTGVLSPDDSIMVVISTDNGTTWNRSGILAVIDATDNLGATPMLFTVPLSAYSGVVRIGFYVQSTVLSTVSTDFFLDNVEIRATPACPDIAGNMPTVVSATSTTAEIVWTSTGSPTQFQVEYGAVGHTPGTGTIVSAAASPVTLTGLTGNTSYEVYVRQICGTAGNGAWSYPASFITNVTPNWTEDFTLAFPPQGWTRAAGLIKDTTVFSTTTTSSWIADGFANNGTTGAARVNVFSTSADEWLMTPTIELPSNGSAYELTFDMSIMEFASSTLEGIIGVDDTVMVVISTDNGATWSRSNVLYMIHQGNKPAGFSWPVSISLMGYSGNIKIGFYGESTVSNEDIDVFIDNVAITENCALVPASISGVTFLSAPAQHNVQFNITQGSRFVLQARSVGDANWLTPKSWVNTSTTNTNFLVRAPGVQTEVRVGTQIEGIWYYSCPFSFSPPCQPMTVSAIQLVAPFCEGDSALLKVIDNGGFKSKTFLWNTGQTARFIYGQQGQTYSVTVTDEAGCSQNASVTVSNLVTTYTPKNFTLAKPNQVTFIGSWTAPTFGPGVTLIGYRMLYRQVNVGASWIQTPISTNTTATVNFTGSCRPSANYEFTVFARVNDNGVVYNTQVACNLRRFYNGSGGCTTAKSDDISDLGVTAYPNPTQGDVYVALNGEASSIELFDMNGKLLFKSDFDGQSEAIIPMNDFAAGMYMLNIQSAAGTFQERVVKN